MRFKKGDAVTLRGDKNFIGVVVHGHKDKCNQIPVYWVTWHGDLELSVILCEPYKLERFLPVHRSGGK